LKDFDSNFEQFSKKSSQKLFLRAVEEAKNPSLLDKPMVQESEEEKIEEKKKVTRKRNRASEALPTKSTASTGRKRRKSAPAADYAEEAPESVAEKENQKQVERSPKEQLLRLRMKLQKFLQQETERTVKCNMYFYLFS
jgi:hypothetical protein